MRIGSLSVCVTAVLALSVSLVGCGSDSAETPARSSSGTPAALDADHGDHAGHAHPSEGPHGGHLIELGNEEYYAELLHDEETHKVTVHLLDAAGKDPVGVDQPEITVQLFHDGEFISYALKAAAGQVDSASTFEIVDAGLCDVLCSEEDVQGRLQATINGKPYSGDIQHTPHEGHDHGEHAHEGHDHDGHDHEDDAHDAHDDHDSEDHEGHDH